MFNPVNVLPLHLACQLLVSENSSFVNIDINTTLPKLTTELPSGYVVLPDFGVAYKYFNYKVRWNVARKYCVGQGGNLAVVDTFEKLEYVLDMNKSDSHMHVGFHKLFDNAEWIDLRTGLPAPTIPWRAEPFHSDTRRCTALTKDRTGVTAIDCNETYSFVCEVSMFRD